MQKHLLPILLLLIPLCYIEAKQKSPFRLENDTILHICSNIQEQYYENMSLSGMEMPFYYASVVIEEGVDSAWVYIPYGYGSTPLPVRLLSIPSSLKFFIWDGPSIEKVQLNPKNPYLCWENGALYSRDMKNLYFWHSEEKGDETVFQVPETVENIWEIPNHFSKVIIPERCKKAPEYGFKCDTLIIHSTHPLNCLKSYMMSDYSYLYSLSDSAVVHILMENLWESIKNKNTSAIDRGIIHCPNYDVRKRDTSWMRESYRLTCIMEDGDTLVGIDTIPSERRIQSVKIEGIADENLRFVKQDNRYRFYVATYDTLYCLPLEVYVKTNEPEPKLELTWSDFGEVRDSVLIIREDVDSLPDLRGSFRKVIIPKRTHYLEGSIECDSVFIYSDSLYGACYDSWNCIDADYYYVENEQLYLSLKCSFMGKNRSAEVYCPNADIRKRDLSVQKNTNPPIWKDAQGNVIDLTRLRPTTFWEFSQLTIEGIDPRNLWVFYDRKNRKSMMKSRWESDKDGSGKLIWWVPAAYGDLELEYAVRTYDTLLILPQKTQVRIVKQDGSPWEDDINPMGSCLYYVPKGETCESLMKSGKKIMYWKSGDTIPRRYLKRLALGALYKNGECGPTDGRIFYHLEWKDKRNYLYDSGIYMHIKELTPKNPFLQIPPNHPKEVWMLEILQLHHDCIPRRLPIMHFYVGR